LQPKASRTTTITATWVTVGAVTSSLPWSLGSKSSLEDERRFLSLDFSLTVFNPIQNQEIQPTILSNQRKTNNSDHFIVSDFHRLFIEDAEILNHFNGNEA
jgi:hypothetical protein